MSDTKRSFGAVLIALAVILIGLFLVCAQQRGTVNGSDMTADDEAFKQELLEMLDMSEDQKPAESTDTEVVSNESSEDAGDDVLSLLMPDSSDTPTFAPETPETTQDVFFADSEPASPTRQQPAAASTDGVDRDMFLQVKNEVARLEKIYDSRSGAADSLRRIIENRTGRIKELETRLASVSSAGAGRSGRSTSGSRNAADPAFIAAYEGARSKFESYDYQGAIDAFQALLKQFPNEQMADNCQYWTGESYYGLKQFQTAIIEFQKVFAYVQNDKYDDAQLMIAQSYSRLGQKDRARTEFESFINNYTDSEYYSVAKRRVENI